MGPSKARERTHVAPFVERIKNQVKNGYIQQNEDNR
jgi:hypothetical protein